MLEFHHAQYITISLAYHTKASVRTPPGDLQKQITAQLQEEIQCFELGFVDWINSHTSYVEALNGWLRNCISKAQRAFSPRRVVAPPIFLLCLDWSARIKSLPSEELSNARRSFLDDLHHSSRNQAEEMQKKRKPLDPPEEGELDGEEGMNDDLSYTHGSLTNVLDRLTKFSEASLKMYEDIRQKSEIARNAYLNYRPPRSFSI